MYTLVAPECVVGTVGVNSHPSVTVAVLCQWFVGFIYSVVLSWPSAPRAVPSDPPLAMVFGLNSAANKAQATPCSDATPPKAIDGTFISKAPMKLFVEGKQMDTWGKEFASVVTDESGKELFTASSKMSGMTNLEITYTAPGGATICVIKGKGGLMKAGASIFVKDAEFGAIEIAKGITSAAATYTVGGDASQGGTVTYKAEKYTTIYFFMTVLDASGNIVAKCAQPGMSPKKLEVEVGTGVDLLAVMGLAGTVGASSGSAAGGLAGAGITT